MLEMANKAIVIDGTAGSNMVDMICLARLFYC